MLTYLLQAADASASSGSSAGGMGVSLITFVLIILIFYFLMIRPQKKRDKEIKAMLDAMKKGDKVVTIGGIHGTVIGLKKDTVVVKVDDNTRIEFNRGAISQVINPAAEKKEADAKKDGKDAKNGTVEAPAAQDGKSENK